MVADDSGFVSALYDSTISLDPQLLAQADSLLENVAMCTFVVFPKEKRLFFSKGMTDYLGPVAAEDMLLDNFLEFTDPDEQRNLKVRYEEGFYDLAADNHKVVSFEHNIISHTGHLYHVRVTMQAVKKENHLLIFGMMEDYTSSFGERPGARLHTRPVLGRPSAGAYRDGAGKPGRRYIALRGPRNQGQGS